MVSAELSSILLSFLVITICRTSTLISYLVVLPRLTRSGFVLVSAQLSLLLYISSVEMVLHPDVTSLIVCDRNAGVWYGVLQNSKNTSSHPRLAIRTLILIRLWPRSLPIRRRRLGRFPRTHPVSRRRA